MGKGTSEGRQTRWERKVGAREQVKTLKTNPHPAKQVEAHLYATGRAFLE